MRCLLATGWQHPGRLVAPLIGLALAGILGCSENPEQEEPQTIPTTPFEGDVSPDFIGATIRGHAEQRLGSALACEDLDGDGLDELIVGTPYDSTQELEAGGALIFKGPLEGDLDSSSAHGTILGDRRFAAAGWSVTAIGDIGSDGKGDFAIGAYADTLTGSVTGSVFVFEGPVAGTVSLDAASAVLTGEGEFDKAGWAVASAGDINGDGLSDLLVGAYTADTAEHEDCGAVYVAMGPLGGRRELEDSQVIIRGVRDEGYVGWSVAGLGDVDGDGFDDLAIGGVSPSLSEAGPSAWVFRGPISRGDMTVDDADAAFVSSSGFARVAGVGNVLGSEGSDLAIGAYEHESSRGRTGALWLYSGAALSGELGPADAAQAFLGEQDGDAAGWVVSTAGDVDGDGLSDVLLGAPNADANGPDSGAAYLLRTTTSGDAETARLSGLAALDGAGGAVLGGCDFNGDGQADIAVGSPGAGSSPPYSPDGGAIYIYYGATSVTGSE